MLHEAYPTFQVEGTTFGGASNGENDGEDS